MKEIEHKFIINPKLLPKLRKGKNLIQGYLSRNPVVRVRLQTNHKKQAWLTIKGKGSRVREEFEWPIANKIGKKLMKLCGDNKLKKIRYEVGQWEIDEFRGRLKDLWMAEIELKSKKTKLPKLPPWIVTEVTYDPKYTNANLATIKSPP